MNNSLDFFKKSQLSSLKRGLKFQSHLLATLGKLAQLTVPPVSLTHSWSPFCFFCNIIDYFCVSFSSCPVLILHFLPSQVDGETVLFLISTPIPFSGSITEFSAKYELHLVTKYFLALQHHKLLALKTSLQLLHADYLLGRFLLISQFSCSVMSDSL